VLGAFTSTTVGHAIRRSGLGDNLAIRLGRNAASGTQMTAAAEASGRNGRLYVNLRSISKITEAQ
jgi:hypothetical protein